MKTLFFIIMAIVAFMHAGNACAQETLKLPDLLKEAEAKSPVLAASRSEYQAAKERIPQAGTFDNPMIGLGVQSLPVDSFAFNREPMTGKMLELSQAVPFFGKRALRREAARYESEAADAQYRSQALLLRADVKKAYYDLYYIKKSLGTVEKNIKLMRNFKDAAQAQYSVGKGIMKDVIKAQLEISTLVEKRIELRKEDAVKRAYLASLLGRETPVAGEVEDISPTKITPGRDEIVAYAIKNRPALAAAAAMIGAAEAKAGLARKARYPDFKIKADYMQRDRLENGMDQSDMVSAMVSVDLPVWYGSKINPMIREAADEKSRAESGREAALVETTSKVYGMTSEIEQADRTLKLYKEALIPQANDDLSSGLAAYETGKGDFLTLLDSRRTLFDLELGYYNTLTMREKAVAELEAVAGKEF